MAKKYDWQRTTTAWNGSDQFVIELGIDIDWNEIAKVLGQKAFRNKSGKAGMLGGAIKAAIIQSKKVER